MAVLAIAGFSTAGFSVSYTEIIDDGADSGLQPGQDIDKIYMAEDASNYYFKMDMVGAMSLTGNNFAGYNGIYIDLDQNDSTGFTGSNYDYFHSSLDGFEFLADAHFGGTVSLSNTVNHYHTLTSPDGLDAGNNSTWDGSYTIEYRIDKEFFDGDMFCLAGATVEEGSEPENYDTTSSYCVPEPTTMALLGACGLFLRKRKS
ncbi:PEP-CTERM sorting domain-containing protein [Sedimentisphaera cyanobacteriorum]|nr:PEP-CTERM sorting domain-containing protein [Sedimentisphaera cyanobacteriorum]